VAQLAIDAGVTMRLACSWRLSVGRDCAFECTIYGTDGAVSIRNVAGSFYDFVAYHQHGPNAELLTEPPDAWGPRALAAWARSLAVGRGFDPEAELLVERAAILDEIYRVGA
jgi:predicted dehydrogenase